MNDTNEKSTEKKEKLFTQKELETIVEHRLARERKNNDAFNSIRDSLAEIRKSEPFRSLSNAGVADRLSELAGMISADTKDTDDDPDAIPEADGKESVSSDTDGKEPYAKAEKDGEKDGDEPLQKMTPEYDAEKARREKDIARFIEAYDEQTLVSALGDNAFRAFCIGKQGGILELYNSYKAFLSALSQSPEAKKYRAAQSGLASTGFSGSASSAVDYGKMLTDNQKKIAKAAGMPYKQYVELLSQIPSKKLNFSK